MPKIQSQDGNSAPPDNSIIKDATESKKEIQHLVQKQGFSPSDNLMRLVILCIAALFVVLGFIAYLRTGNGQLLLGETSVLAYPFFRIVDYYFVSKRSG